MALINTTTTGVLGSTFFGDGTGDLTVQQNGVTVNKITSAPAFFASIASAQSLSTASYTKMQMGTEIFDTNNNYDSTTNYRFTPTVAGYYLVTISLFWTSTVVSPSNGIFKNGSIYSSRYDQGTFTNLMQAHTGLIYLNGTTDYIENFAQISSGTTAVYTGNNSSFQAFLARAA
jgi:hypothetical protein